MNQTENRKKWVKVETSKPEKKNNKSDLGITIGKTDNWTAEVQYLSWYGQTTKGKAYTKNNCIIITL